VPREPFAFGGLAGTDSKFGSYGDITSEGAVEFFSNRIKVTTRWPVPEEMTEAGAKSGGKKRKAEEDVANFNGNM